MTAAQSKGKEQVREVIAPEELPVKYPNANIVVASINYYSEIKERLARLGTTEERILSYLEFWPEHTDWEELEATVNWENVRHRAEIFAAWIDPSAALVADYSRERNFLRDFLPESAAYSAPDYIRFHGDALYGDFSGQDPAFRADVSSCLAMLMSFENPKDVIDYLCRTTERAIIASYVPLEALPDMRLRRSINYHNDYTAKQWINAFEKRGFHLVKEEQDPFDAVHTVYLFENRNDYGG